MGGFRWERAAVSFVAAALAVAAAACGTDDGTAVEGEDAGSSRVTTDELIDEPTDGALLRVTDGKDGDSFVASDGVEYRLGLVDAPELSQPCGPEAAAFTNAFLADGFRVDAYATDTYRRTVAEVFDTDGRSLNVALADSGLGDDEYLEQFRHENPDLAGRLDTAFAGAETPGCAAPTTTVAPVPLVPETPPPTSPPTTSAPPTTSPPTAPPTTAPAASDCHPAYAPCVRIKGDGSGNGDANDLDCGDIGHRVQVAGSTDPYRLDRDGDGWGCESYG